MPRNANWQRPEMPPGMKIRTARVMHDVQRISDGVIVGAIVSNWHYLDYIDAPCGCNIGADGYPEGASLESAHVVGNVPRSVFMWHHGEMYAPPGEALCFYAGNASKYRLVPCA